MVKVWLSLLAILAGLFAGFLVVGGGETIGHLIYSPPIGLDLRDPESLTEAMKSLPAGSFVSILLSWAGGSFAGAWVAARIAVMGKVWHGMVIGVLFLAASVATMLQIPHPTWVWILGIAEPLVLAYLGAKVALRQTEAKPTTTETAGW